MCEKQVVLKVGPDLALLRGEVRLLIVRRELYCGFVIGPIYMLFGVVTLLLVKTITNETY
jgi:hypothetical protein